MIKIGRDMDIHMQKYMSHLQGKLLKGMLENMSVHINYVLTITAQAFC